MKAQRNVVRLAWCVILAVLAANAGCNDPAGGSFGKLPLNKAELRMATE